MPSPMLILAVVLAFIANGFYWHANGVNSENTRWKAKTFQEIAQASEAARKQESMWQGVVNETAKNYQGRVDGIRRGLDADLERLRQRPERASGVSAAPRAGCAGGTGAELSGADAEFLSREAARADQLRAGVEACYEFVDAVK